ncbi:MAG: type II toxin-antitoxin system Phd/YefM family antitoxin [Bacteroidota bacterium]
MKTISYSELREKLKTEMDMVAEDHIPLIVKRSRGNDMVIMSLEDYNSYMETINLLSSASNAEHLFKSINQAEEGKTVDVTLEELKSYEK